MQSSKVWFADHRGDEGGSNASRDDVADLVGGGEVLNVGAVLE